MDLSSQFETFLSLSSPEDRQWPEAAVSKIKFQILIGHMQLSGGRISYIPDRVVLAAAGQLKAKA